MLITQNTMDHEQFKKHSTTKKHFHNFLVDNRPISIIKAIDCYSYIIRDKLDSEYVSVLLSNLPDGNTRDMFVRAITELPPHLIHPNAAVVSQEIFGVESDYEEDADDDYDVGADVVDDADDMETYKRETFDIDDDDDDFNYKI